MPVDNGMIHYGYKTKSSKQQSFASGALLQSTRSRYIQNSSDTSTGHLLLSIIAK